MAVGLRGQLLAVAFEDMAAVKVLERLLKHNIVPKEGILLIFVRHRVHYISTPLAHVPVKDASPQKIALHYAEERRKCDALINCLLQLCEKFQVIVEVVELVDVSLKEAVMEQILQHKIQNLVLCSQKGFMGEVLVRNMLSYFKPDKTPHVPKCASFCKVFRMSRSEDFDNLNKLKCSMDAHEAVGTEPCSNALKLEAVTPSSSYYSTEGSVQSNSSSVNSSSRFENALSDPTGSPLQGTAISQGNSPDFSTQEHGDIAVENVEGMLVPKAFLCPLSHVVMEDPVTAADGCSYEYTAILDWLRDHSTSPVQKCELEHRSLHRDYDLQRKIADWKRHM